MANETELAERLAWAMNRPDVKKRHAEGAVFHDEPSSFLCALNTRMEKAGEIQGNLPVLRDGRQTECGPAPCIRWRES